MSSQLNYKLAIKEQIKFFSTRDANRITQKKLARHLGIQYTYLSRILNSEHEHLKEDLLYEALDYLEFPATRIDFYMNARVLLGSTSESRRDSAAKRIAAIQAEEFSEVEKHGRMEAKVVAETQYMVDPFATIVLASLSIQKYRKHPRLLADQLKLDMSELKAVLDKIEAAGFIERGDDHFDIKKLVSPRLYFSHDHQIMRLHQQQIKLLSLSYLSKISEDRKRSFMATFSADPIAFEKIKDEFKKFLKNVEVISKSAQSKKTYQITFDLFDWL
jgi:DNA-binding MarR family transcriptional regulator